MDIFPPNVVRLYTKCIFIHGMHSTYKYNTTLHINTVPVEHYVCMLQSLQTNNKIFYAIFPVILCALCIYISLSNVLYMTT